MGLIIKNGKVFYKGALVDKDIFIEDGKIVEKCSGEAFDASGLVVLPGMIDCHVHFREPGATQKEDFLTGSRAAAKGGVTTIIDMPNNNPPTTTSAALEQKRQLAKKSIVNYGFYFGATSDNIAEINTAKNVAGVKVYMGASTGSLLVTDDAALHRIFLCGRLVTVHAEDEAMIKKNEEKYRNEHNPEVHCKIRNNEVAASAVKKAIEIAKAHNTRLHIAHVSTKEELALIAGAKNVTCETTPHHLFLTSAAMKKMGNFAKMNPPLRSEGDVAALWKAINDGTITCIATDHAPHLPSEKQQDYWKAPSGVPGVETMLPLMMNAVNERKISLQQLVKLCSENPAKLMGLERKGSIEEGFDADLVIVDLKKEETIKNSDIASKCRWTPFDGMKVRGRVIATVVNGEIAYNRGSFFESKGREVQYGS
ncbi:MAG: dihydroorotase [Candidatus Woesearchaeota archaeon]